MNILQQMKQESISLGCRKGEDAGSWQKRDPQAAAKFAAFLVANKKQIVSAVSDVLQK
jgi:hypothetical protein